MDKIISFACLSLFAFTSCSSSSNVVKMTVASEQADCVGVAPQKCLLVKKEGESTAGWMNFYSPIEGFNYERGNEYELQVKEEKREGNIPADASSIRYILVKELSKKAKLSEGLPNNIKKPEAVVSNWQWVGRVLEITEESIGRGAAAGQMKVKLAKILVTSSSNTKFKEGDTVYCELIASPKVMPQPGREYVFKAKNIHPAHAKGIYLLDTEVQDLI